MVTGGYWAFTATDGAIRMLVVYFHLLGYSPFEAGIAFLLCWFFGIDTNLVGGCGVVVQAAHGPRLTVRKRPVRARGSVACNCAVFGAVGTGPGSCLAGGYRNKPE